MKKKQKQKEKEKKQGAGSSKAGEAKKEEDAVDRKVTDAADAGKSMAGETGETGDVGAEASIPLEDGNVDDGKSENAESGTPKAKVKGKEQKMQAGTAKGKDAKPPSTPGDKRTQPAAAAATPQSPTGEKVQDIYRKQVQRIEELERDNKRLQAEALDAETRWKKSEEELEERREASGEMADLKAKAKEAEELVCIMIILSHKLVGMAKRKFC